MDNEEEYVHKMKGMLLFIIISFAVIKYTRIRYWNCTLSFITSNVNKK